MGFLPLALFAAAETRPPIGQQTFESSGTFVVPDFVKSVSVVCVGGGESGADQGQSGGKGGSLAYATSISVTPGASLTVVVGAGGSGDSVSGGDSYFIDTATLIAYGGGRSGANGSAHSGGGAGGAGALVEGSVSARGAGGAGGYSGNGGNGGGYNFGDTRPTAGSGGGGGGGSNGDAGQSGVLGGAGGGVGILGEGASGAAGTEPPPDSGGRDGGTGSPNGTSYGWGGGGSYFTAPSEDGGNGAVRIIWGEGRAYPSTNTEDL